LGRFAIEAGRGIFAEDSASLAFRPAVNNTTTLLPESQSLYYPQRGMDFKTATDRLTDRITADDIAEAFGVARNTIARARLDRSNPGYRPPPENWRPVIAQLARARSRELAEFAQAVEAS
jgi:hypothetical protein